MLVSAFHVGSFKLMHFAIIHRRYSSSLVVAEIPVVVRGLRRPVCQNVSTITAIQQQDDLFIAYTACQEIVNFT